jgi:hypothetical protein
MRSFLHKFSARLRFRPLLAILVLCLAPKDAFAYVDPGSGLLIIQGLLAIIGGIIIFLKDPIAGCKRLWARYFSKPKDRDQ